MQYIYVCTYVYTNKKLYNFHKNIYEISKTICINNTKTVYKEYRIVYLFYR